MFYKTHPLRHHLLAKWEAIFHAIWRYFQPNTLYNYANFKNKTCILHHFAFLFWWPTHNFSSPNIRFLPLKRPFLMPISPFLPLFLMARRGFVYTISADIYAHWPAFSSKLHCILHHFTLRLAPKCTPFSTKTHSILHQNAVHLAPKRSVFSIKWPKIGWERRLLKINIHFACMYNCPHFASKQTSARIDFLRPG